ncbi:ABC transporter substrate-binding protein [Paracraurococcus ruber]|uniref:ABC transporter substrate-binding protein n=1 Tax=Paracraurococcus ruber TaxID=77675 RepID=A0ABS1D3S2_9PROT|nr:ABC transporter substrate-binding protein [Paracraurococcus ruber]MBK1660907.1 ABC transporter substrate-binding protein [Paracraurococcus ruber]TDG29404.1 ABC transporter substrate-binding protein [Paracraurococcus ruber]
MNRRTLLAAGLAGLAAPRFALAQGSNVLRFIPQIDLAFLDPHFTTAYVTRGHGHMVFDTLYGQDSSFKAHPQMVEGHVVEEDGRRWTLTLREGLLWHDGEKVLARDCVASIRRWARRDALGDALMQATEELSAPDDRRIVFRLKRPFPLLPDALGKVTSPMPAMMPERLANTDPFRQVTEMVGSGPFRFVAGERVPGSRNVYAKFERYVPRQGGAPDWNSGAKLVHFDRVEWTTITDAATKVAALQRGEQDWWENPTHDLMPLLRRDRRVRIDTTNPTGAVNMMRLNHLQPPFDKPLARQALLYAFDQASFMQAIVGTDPKDFHVPHGVFCPNTPMASEAGLEPLKGPRNLDKAREMLKASGYGGEKVPMLVATDYAQFKAIGEVAADAMQKIGLNLDYVATDWGTMLQRRNNKGPADQGGWSCFSTGWEGADHMDPSNHYAIRGNGDQPSAWPGWCTSPKLEALRNAWFDAPDLAAQQAICRDMQVQCMQDVPSIPLGQFVQPTAYRTNVTNVARGFPTFWGVRKA